MIEDPPRLTIRRTVARPSERRLSAFDGVPTGYVVDALGGTGGMSVDVGPVLPFERAPINYGRERVLIETASDRRWAWTYFANSAVCMPDLRPSAEYMAHLLAGREYLSPSYFDKLSRWPLAE